MTATRLPDMEWWSEGDQHALWRYRPRGANEDEASQLVLRFKDRYADAIAIVAGRAADWLRIHAAALQSRHVRYVVATPRSRAGLTNVACERVASHLADANAWLTHIPAALERTVTIEPSHRGGRRSLPQQLATMRYAGPPLVAAAQVDGLRCLVCEAEYVNAAWLQRHLESARHRANAAVPERPGILLLDDVVTTGTTSAAARQLLQSAGAGAVVGLFVAHTSRDVRPRKPAADSGRWAVLFDLDGTLVDSLALKPLRDSGRWAEVHASLHMTHLRPGTEAMLAELATRGLATGVVTQARRRYAKLLVAHHRLPIEVLTAYEDVARRKPHPDPILHAVRTLGVEPSRTIYVGDEVRDVVAAHRAGAVAVGYGPDVARAPAAGYAAAFASNWPEVLNAVARIMGR